MAEKGRTLITGRVDSTLDSKGRAPIGRMSSPLGKRCAVAVEGNGCIACYAQEEWKAKSERIISEFDELNAGMDDVLRLLHGFADDDVSIDDANRVNLPPWIRSLAGLEEQDALVVVGRGTALEIWKKQVWDEKFSAMTVDSRKAQMEDALRRMGFGFAMSNPVEVSN